MTLQDQYDDAMFDYSRGDLDSTIERLKAILASDSAHFDAQLSLAMCYYRKGDYATAIVEGHKAEALGPKDPLVHTNLSLFYVKAGDKQKAEHHGTQARVSSWRETIAQKTPPPPVDPALQMAQSEPPLMKSDSQPPPAGSH